MTALWLTTQLPTGSLGYGGAQQRLGTDFHVPASQIVNRAYWYQHATGDPQYTEFALFNRDTGARLLHVAVPAGSYTAGWNNIDFADGFSCVNGVLYQLTGVCGPATTYEYYSTASSTYADLSHFSDMAGRFADSAYASNYGPATGNSGVAGWAIGPGDGGPGFAGDGGVGGTTGVGDPVVGGDVAAWLSDDAAVNKHQADGLPWQTQLGVAALGLTVGGRTGRVLTLGSLVAAANYLVEHADDILSAVNQVRTLLGSTSDVVTDTQTQLTQMETRLSDLINAQSTRNFPPFPGAGWSQVDSIDFDTNLLWDVAADLYVVVLSQYVPVRSISDTAAGTWLHRLGWWCPMRGSLASSRSFFEFQQQALEDHGRRMHGLALQCERGTLGNVQAWALA